MKIAINGFGRIGRCVLRALEENKDLYGDMEVIAINDLAPISTNTHLLKYDSVHGRFNAEISHDDENLILNGKKIRAFAEREIKNIPWGELGIDIVMECTGVFRKSDQCQEHINSGAKKVILSVPAKDDMKTIVLGVNDEQLQKSDTLISNGSCTTNCLAPMAKVLNRAFGIIKGHMTTIHSYTNDQRVVDCYHSDERRARACNLSMIPTSTGAAKAVGIVLPELKGKLDGVSIRVPTPNVSFVDLSFEAGKNTSAEEINEAIKKSANGELKGILSYTDEPLVSIDFVHNPLSCVFDLSQTKVMEGNFVRVGAWYDNEWGFSNRMLDMAKKLK